MLLRRLVADSGRLFYDRGPGNRSELIPLAEGRFLMAGTEIVVTMSAGRDSLRLDLPDERPVVLSRMPSVEAGSLVGLAGSYYSSDLRTLITVEPRDSVILIKPERGSVVTFTPAFADAFTAGSLFLRVVREAGRVTGLEVSSGERARNVRFDRQP